MKKKKIFDIAIIGSGPTGCFSALSLKDNLKNKKKIILITGESDELIESKAHPNFTKNISKKKKFFEKFKISNNKNSFLFSCGLEGGLSNFWGGQLQMYSEKDNFIKNFNNFKEYKFYCKKIRNYINFFKIKKTLKKSLISKSFEDSNPILLNDNSLFKKIISNLIKENFLIKEKKRVSKIIKLNNRYQIKLKNSGIKIESKKIIMACGTLSASKIILNSTDSTQSSFNDHYPHYLFCLDVKNFIKNTLNIKNFLTIKRNKSKKNIFFASVYDLSNFNLNEFSSYFFKTNFKLLNKYKMPNFFKLIKPIQIWTPKMLNFYKMKKSLDVQIFSDYDKDKDKIYYLFKKNLNKSLHIIKESKNYLGFHYHNLNFQINKKNYSFDKILKYKFGNNIVCVDASSVKDISVMPPTFSLMALSYFKTKKFIKK